MPDLPQLVLPERKIHTPNSNSSSPTSPDLLSPTSPTRTRPRGSSLSALVRTSTATATATAIQSSSDTYNFRAVLQATEEQRGNNSKASSIRSGLSATSRKARSFVDGLKETADTGLRRVSSTYNARRRQQEGSPVREYPGLDDMHRPVGDSLPSDGPEFENWKKPRALSFQVTRQPRSTQKRVLTVRNPD